MINCYARERPRAFANAGPEAEAVALEMMQLSAQCAREGKQAAVEPDELVNVGRLAAQSGALAMNIRRTKMTDEHHADDVARGAGENKSVHQTIVLNGADPARLRMPPKREGA